MNDKKIKYPIDKANRVLWNEKVWNKKKPNGTVQINVATSDEMAKKQRAIIMHEYEITRYDVDKVYFELTPFLKLIYHIIWNIREKEIEKIKPQHPEYYRCEITPNQIYNHMGYLGEANHAIRNKIHEAVMQLWNQKIAVDNDKRDAAYRTEVQAHPRTKKFRIKLTHMLEIEVDFEHQTHGGKKGICYTIKEDLAMFRYTNYFRQYRWVSEKLLQIPINLNNLIIGLNYLLIDLIIFMFDNPETSRVLTFDNIFKQLYINGVTNKERKARERVKKEYMPRLLEHYKDVGFIGGVEKVDNGYQIITRDKAKSKKEKLNKSQVKYLTR